MCTCVCVYVCVCTCVRACVCLFICLSVPSDSLGLCVHLFTLLPAFMHVCNFLSPLKERGPAYCTI